MKSQGKLLESGGISVVHLEDLRRCSISSFLAGFSVVVSCFMVSLGRAVFAEELQIVELSCYPLGKMRIKEATPNQDIRSPLSDLLFSHCPLVLKSS